MDAFGTPTFGHLQAIQRTTDPMPSTIQDMRIDHCRLDALMAQDLLDRPDVVTALEEMRREGVPQGVAGRVLDHSGGPARVVKGPLEGSLMEMMTTALACPRVQ